MRYSSTAVEFPKKSKIVKQIPMQTTSKTISPIKRVRVTKEAMRNINRKMTKYKIGYLDKSEQNRATFYRVFKNDFTVIFFEDNSKIKTLEELLSQIDELGLDALAVDYKLADSGWVRYNGDEVINKIWDCKRYFPVFLLTSYTGEAIQKTENAFLVNEKDVLNKKKAYKLLIDKVKEAIKSYGKIVSKK